MRATVIRSIFISFLLCLTFVPGCLEFERPCPENTCFPLTSSALNSILEQQGELDALILAEEFEKLNVRTVSKFSDDGIEGEMVWEVEKDDEKNRRLVRNTVWVGGVQVVGYEIWDGGHQTFTRTLGQWMLGRDADPVYEDPFAELARLATLNPEGRWPPFRYDISQFSGLSWTITGDAMESYQIAHGKRESDDIYLELQGITPEIVGISIFSGGLDDSNLVFEMKIANEDWQGGLESGTSADPHETFANSQESPKSPVPFIPIPQYQESHGGITSVIGTVPSGMVHEAPLSEIELHSFSGGGSVASLTLSLGETNVTSGDGSWWHLSWVDAGRPGLLSNLDTYSIRTNSTSVFDIRIYDNWAQAWSDREL